MEMLHYNFLAVRWTKSVQTQRVYLMRNLDLRRTSAPDLCTETASPFHRDWNFLWQNSLIQSAWPVSGHTCLAAHSRTSIKSLEDMSWKDLFCLTRVFPLLAHRAFRFPVKFIQLCHHAISGCLRSCLTSQYFRKWGQPSARPLGRNSELEKFQKCLFFACAKKKKKKLSTFFFCHHPSAFQFAASFQECSHYFAQWLQWYNTELCQVVPLWNARDKNVNERYIFSRYI